MCIHSHGQIIFDSFIIALGNLAAPRGFCLMYDLPCFIENPASKGKLPLSSMSYQSPSQDHALFAIIAISFGVGEKAG